MSKHAQNNCFLQIIGFALTNDGTNPLTGKHPSNAATPLALTKQKHLQKSDIEVNKQ
jgi:hypothetical protein